MEIENAKEGTVNPVAANVEPTSSGISEVTGRAGGDEETQTQDGEHASQAAAVQCEWCSTTKTPLWRSGPSGPRTLCNACGVRFSRMKKNGAFHDDDAELRRRNKRKKLTVSEPRDDAPRDVEDTAHMTGLEPLNAWALPDGCPAPREDSDESMVGAGAEGHVAHVHVAAHGGLAAKASGAGSAGVAAGLVHVDHEDEYGSGLQASLAMDGSDGLQLALQAQLGLGLAHPLALALGGGSAAGWHLPAFGVALPAPPPPPAFGPFGVAHGAAGSASLPLPLPARRAPLGLGFDALGPLGPSKRPRVSYASTDDVSDFRNNIDLMIGGGMEQDVQGPARVATASPASKLLADPAAPPAAAGDSESDGAAPLCLDGTLEWIRESLLLSGNASPASHQNTAAGAARVSPSGSCLTGSVHGSTSRSAPAVTAPIHAYASHGQTMPSATSDCLSDMFNLGPGAALPTPISAAYPSYASEYSQAQAQAQASLQLRSVSPPSELAHPRTYGFAPRAVLPSAGSQVFSTEMLGLDW